MCSIMAHISPFLIFLGIDLMSWAPSSETALAENKGHAIHARYLQAIFVAQVSSVIVHGNQKHGAKVWKNHTYWNEPMQIQEIFFWGFCKRALKMLNTLWTRNTGIMSMYTRNRYVSVSKCWEESMLQKTRSYKRWSWVFLMNPGAIKQTFPICSGSLA